MRTFIKKLLIFCVPFLLAVVLFFCFDPCDYFALRGSSIYMQRSVASAREVIMKKPKNIILGDSRMANLNRDYIKQVSGDDYTIMAYGGATLNDNIEQFWFAAERCELEKAVFGLDFYRLNANSFTNGFEQYAMPNVESVLRYAGVYYYWQEAFWSFESSVRLVLADTAGLECLRPGARDDPSSLEQEDPALPTDTVEGYRSDLFDYSNIIIDQTLPYGGLEKYIPQLEEIAEYCDENGIELVFVIPNVNRVIWDRVIYAGELTVYIDAYKDRLKSLGTVYDFEFDNAFARDDSNFLDGLHLCREEKMRLARVIFAGEPDDYCVITSRDEYVASKFAG